MIRQILGGFFYSFFWCLSRFGNPSKWTRLKKVFAPYFESQLITNYPRCLHVFCVFLKGFLKANLYPTNTKPAFLWSHNFQKTFHKITCNFFWKVFWNILYSHLSRPSLMLVLIFPFLKEVLKVNLIKAFSEWAKVLFSFWKVFWNLRPTNTLPIFHLPS